MIFEGDMLFDRSDIGNYQPDMVQNGPNEARVVLNHESPIISDEGSNKKHVVPKKSCYYYYYYYNIPITQVSVNR